MGALLREHGATLTLPEECRDGNVAAIVSPDKPEPEEEESNEPEVDEFGLPIGPEDEGFEMDGEDED